MSADYPLRVTEARASARREADAMGITPGTIGALVDTFYGHVRSDADLGPIFEGAIGDDWGPHLDTMKAFWSAMIFHDGGYAGRPMPAHVKLKPQIAPEHFTRWLGLFEQTLGELDVSPAARTAFLERANRIAGSFQMHLFYSPYE